MCILHPAVLFLLWYYPIPALRPNSASCSCSDPSLIDTSVTNTNLYAIARAAKAWVPVTSEDVALSWYP